MGPAQKPSIALAPLMEEKDFMLPQRGQNYRRVIAYLNKSRMLPVDLIIDLIHAKLLYQDEDGNCVFPCLDRNGEPKGAIIRGPSQ